MKNMKHIKFFVFGILFCFVQLQSACQEVDIRLNEATQSTYSISNDIFFSIIIKNNSKNIIYFRASGSLFDEKNDCAGYYKRRSHFYSKDTIATHWSPGDCKDEEYGFGLKLLPHDSVIYVYPLAYGCINGNCGIKSSEDYPIGSALKKFPVGTKFTAKIMVNLHNGKGRLIKKEITIGPKDEKSYSLTNAYDKKRFADLTKRIQTNGMYSAMDTLKRFLDTCTNTWAKDQLILYQIQGDSRKIYQNYFKDIFLQLSDKTSLMYVVQDMVNSNTYNYDKLPYNKLALYKEVMGILIKRDKEIANNFYTYTYARNFSWENINACKREFYDPMLTNTFSDKEMEELKKMLIK